MLWFIFLNFLLKYPRFQNWILVKFAIWFYFWIINFENIGSSYTVPNFDLAIKDSLKNDMTCCERSLQLFLWLRFVWKILVLRILWTETPGWFWVSSGQSFSDFKFRFLLSLSPPLIILRFQIQAFIFLVFPSLPLIILRFQIQVFIFLVFRGREPPDAMSLRYTDTSLPDLLGRLRYAEMSMRNTSKILKKILHSGIIGFLKIRSIYQLS